MRILAIDPGKNQGWAFFENNKLTMAGIGRPPSYPCPQRIVVERPHPGKSKASTKDLITLSLRAGVTAGKLEALTGVVAEFLEPNRWKGGAVPKGVMNERVKSRLLPEELEALGSKYDHNVLDAVGIGMYVCGRLGF